jgi:hypothetical protein
MVMDGQIVMENVRRYRAIASLCRQTAALRPLQKWSLLDQAEGWERLAAEEAYFIVCNSTDGDHELVATARAEKPWELMALSFPPSVPGMVQASGGTGFQSPMVRAATFA